MKKIALMTIVGILWFLFIVRPPAECSATAKKRLLIVDLPYLDLCKVSKNYPNLFKLVSTGSIGIVTLPAFFSKSQANHLGRHLFGNSATGLTKPAATSGNPAPRLANRSGSTVLIDGDGIIDQANSNRKQALGYYERLIAGILAEIDFQETLLLVCASRLPGKSGAKTALTTVVLKGPDYSAGILYSPRTRKKGIVSYNDLRSAVLGKVNRQTKRGFELLCVPGDWNSVVAGQPRLYKNYAVRWPLLTVYGYLLLGVIGLVLPALFFRLRFLVRSLAWGYLYLLTAPAVFLVEALLDPVHWGAIVGYALGISGTIFFGLYFLTGENISRLGRKLRSTKDAAINQGTISSQKVCPKNKLFEKNSISRFLVWLSFLTAGLVIADGLLNGYYESKAFLGYSVVSGARYYGIGNEYMGILLGSYITGVTLSLKALGRRRKEILWPAGILIGLVLIHPNFGADVGGGITALMGLGICNYLWLEEPFRFKETIKLLLLTLLVIIFAGVWDVYANLNAMSHLGQLLWSIRENGIGALIPIVIRKLALNFRLITRTPATMILIAVLLCIPFLQRYPPARLRGFMAERKEILAGLTGLSITALIGLLTNDSGIVSAAMLFMFGIGMMMARLTS